MLNFYQSIILITLLFTFLFFIVKFLNNIPTKNITKNKEFLRKYMGAIYLIFGLLKLYDLEKFAKIFSKYDIISKKIKIYPYLYPFIEILLGILLLKNNYTENILDFTHIFMIISIVSVSISLYKGEKLRCGCMGSFFHIPLSYVTLSENIIMILLAKNHKDALQKSH